MWDELSRTRISVVNGHKCIPKFHESSKISFLTSFPPVPDSLIPWKVYLMSIESTTKKVIRKSIFLF